MLEDVIIIEEYGRQTHIDIQFINQLGEHGLIEIMMQQEVQCIPSSQLPLLEKYTRLHYDLDINIEGIEAISHLLKRVETMQNEMENMRRMLRLYEPL